MSVVLESTGCINSVQYEPTRPHPGSKPYPKTSCNLNAMLKHLLDLCHIINIQASDFLSRMKLLEVSISCTHSIRWKCRKWARGLEPSWRFLISTLHWVVFCEIDIQYVESLLLDYKENFRPAWQIEKDRNTRGKPRFRQDYSKYKYP